MTWRNDPKASVPSVPSLTSAATVVSGVPSTHVYKEWPAGKLPTKEDVARWPKDVCNNCGHMFSDEYPSHGGSCPIVRRDKRKWLSPHTPAKPLSASATSDPHPKKVQFALPPPPPSATMHTMVAEPDLTTILRVPERPRPSRKSGWLTAVTGGSGNTCNAHVLKSDVPVTVVPPAPFPHSDSVIEVPAARSSPRGRGTLADSDKSAHLSGSPFAHVKGASTPDEGYGLFPPPPSRIPLQSSPAALPSQAVIEGQVGSMLDVNTLPGDDIVTSSALNTEEHVDAAETQCHDSEELTLLAARCVRDVPVPPSGLCVGRAKRTNRYRVHRARVRSRRLSRRKLRRSASPVDALSPCESFESLVGSDELSFFSDDLLHLPGWYLALLSTVICILCSLVKPGVRT